MSNRIAAIRGMNDVLPTDCYQWQNLESSLKEILVSYGYEEIRFPLVESTALFSRAIGEVTDIVEKEMYTFTDLNGDSLTLRPEGTAPCVRACLEHGLLHNQSQKLWYMGPMFRHEKPQKGRYRQFTQLGVEALNMQGVAVELELISMTKRFWDALNIQHAVQLQINTIGLISERLKYRETLIHYFEQHLNLLDEDSKHRLYKNPLRILDTKNESMHSVIQNAPKLYDVLSEESRHYFDSLCEGLRKMGISYEINPCLVRGLDYYNHTVFEWVTPHLGSQATICAGGRYDELVTQLGGQSTPAAGFAMGLERILLLLQVLNQNPIQKQPFTLFMMATSNDLLIEAMNIAENIRTHYPQAAVWVNLLTGGFKSQFKKADKSPARYALILGEDEWKKQAIALKDLRVVSEQETIALDALIKVLGEKITLMGA